MQSNPPFIGNSHLDLESLPRTPIASWAHIRTQTRSQVQEASIAKSKSWDLEPGEIFSRHADITTAHYVCADVDVDLLLQQRACRGSAGVCLLELGCGVGSFLQRLLQASPHGAADSWPAVNWDRSYGITGAHANDILPQLLQQGIVKRFNLDSLWEELHSPSKPVSGAFDLVVGRHVFGHLIDPLGCACCAFEQLAPGGLLCLIEKFKLSDNKHPLADDCRYKLLPSLGMQSIANYLKDCEGHISQLELQEQVPSLRSLLRFWEQLG
eukprot:CAMPEP_0197713634 /NCGR_PEP_ID=MMETSP1338-20131121/130556_1 /TAXON_ID=43686 ORGANISM="Pelagodinium beii, Strain RCC1491" /NCGR_SAMPLE_ID=MMETSP1338 /ASSEMBLY_ACC=CAM_ASM_000754 /LENGTH=267 /DNA_ID=CAMNT_0043297575 /DNA_START=560 /DNA_END=1359 /DNA_ORIENTATION=-